MYYSETYRSHLAFVSQGIMEEKYLDRLRAEAKAPYRGIRRFFYLAFAASALIGGLIFLMKLLAGEDLSQTLPNLMLQSGILALMLGLLWAERSPQS